MVDFDFVVGKHYKTRRGIKLTLVGNILDFVDNLDNNYPLLFTDKRGNLYTYTVNGNYSTSRSSGDIVAEWQDPHPLEGTPIGTWVIVWDNRVNHARHVRFCYRFLEVRDGKVVVTGSDAAVELLFDNGCRLTSNEI